MVDEKNELDSNKALVVIDSDEQHYENYSEYTFGKPRYTLVTIEKKIVKKNKHKVVLEPDREIKKNWLVGLWVVTLLLIVLVCVSPKIYSYLTHRAEAIGELVSLKCVSAKILVRCLIYEAITMLIITINYTFKLKDIGEKTKITTKEKDFQVPMPNEFYMKRIGTDKETEGSVQYTTELNIKHN